MLHSSEFGTIEFVTIKNDIIKIETNLVLFKVNKLINEKTLIKKLYSDILKFYNSNTKNFIQIYDFTECKSTTLINDIQFGRNYGNFLRDSAAEVLTKYCIGTSIIVNSEIIKNAVNGALYFYSNVKPTKVHNDINESHKWLWQLIRFKGN